MEKVDLSDYYPRDTNSYKLDWFELLTFYKDKVVIYGVGQWSNHIMDWRGCNFYHGRLPKSPTFDNVKDAMKWLRFQVRNRAYIEHMTLSGHHKGEYECSKGCDEREIEGYSSIFFTTLIKGE